MVVVKAYSKRDVTQSLREQGERLENIRFVLFQLVVHALLDANQLKAPIICKRTLPRSLSLVVNISIDVCPW
jgi:hypothetical protein